MRLSEEMSDGFFAQAIDEIFKNSLRTKLKEEASRVVDETVYQLASELELHFEKFRQIDAWADVLNVKVRVKDER